jgi:enoyl-CoA hydratase/carnithine racemase
MTTMSNALTVEKLDGSLVITFDRPEIRSPLSVEVLEELQALIDELIAATEVQRVIFTGREGVFASGADLREIAKVTAGSAREFARRGQRLMNSIASLPQISVAAIDGFCFGGALDLALACRTRIASPRSLFSHPGASLGIITGWGGTQRLPRLIGQARALEMFYLAKRVDGDEALRIGLVDAITQDPLSAAMEYAPDSVTAA